MITHIGVAGKRLRLDFQTAEDVEIQTFVFLTLGSGLKLSGNINRFGTELRGVGTSVLWTSHRLNEKSKSNSKATHEYVH